MMILRKLTFAVFMLCIVTSNICCEGCGSTDSSFDTPTASYQKPRVRCFNAEDSADSATDSEQTNADQTALVSQSVNLGMTKGNRYLAQALYQDARMFFENVLTTIDSDYAPAKYGWSIASFMEMQIELIDSIIEVVEEINGLAGYRTGGGGLERLDPTALQNMSSGIIWGLIDSIVEPYRVKLQMIDTYLTEVEQDTSFNYYFESLPLLIGESKLASVGGCHELSEVKAFHALTRSLAAVLNLLLAYSYSFDLLEFTEALLALENEGVTSNRERALALLAYITAESGDFGELLQTAQLDLVRSDLVSAADLMAGAIETAQSDVEEQVDELFVRDDSGESTVVKFDLELLRENDSGSFGDVMTVVFDDQLRSSLERLRDNLNFNGEPLLYGDSIKPLLQLLKKLFIETEFADILYQLFLAGSGISVTDIRNWYLGGKDHISGSWLELLTSESIGNRVMLDPVAFFEEPVGFRHLLPATFLRQEQPNGILDYRFLFEYECGSELLVSGEESPTGLYCSIDSEVADSSHFPCVTCAPQDVEDYAESFTAAGFEPIAPDGIVSDFAYIPFLDPTFNGMLFLDIGDLPYSAADENYEGYLPADNYSLNKMLAYVLSGEYLSYE